MIRRVAAGLAALAYAGTSPAAAQTNDELAGAVAQTACQGRAGATILNSELAAVLLAHTSGLGFLGESQASSAARVEQLRFVRGAPQAAEGGPLAAFGGIVAAVRDVLIQKLAAPAASAALGLQARHGDGSAVTLGENQSLDAAPDRPEMLFASRSDVVLHCAVAPMERPPRFRPHLAIRHSVEELALPASQIETAGSFGIAYEHDRRRLAGTTTRTSTLTVEGAAGLVLVGQGLDNLVAYGDYSRHRVRTRTEPASPDDAGGDDINALELGILGSRFIGTGADRPSLWLTGRAGVTFDQIDRSRRLVGGLRLAPVFGGKRFGPCRWGALGPVDLGILQFTARCDVALLAEGAHVLRLGRAAAAADAELVAAGGQFVYAIAPARGKPQGPVGGVTLTYLPVLSGKAPDLSSMEASAGYRWWVGKAVGLDLKFSFRNGVERKSLAHENVWGAGFGVIF